MVVDGYVLYNVMVRCMVWVWRMEVESTHAGEMLNMEAACSNHSLTHYNNLLD
jgi:hypothetical protein